MDGSAETIICEVTGKEVTREDAIQFQGKRVGAEGKAILLERLRSGEGEPGEMVAPTVWGRFGGWFVDRTIAALISIVITLAIFFSTFNPPRPGDPQGHEVAQSLFQALMYTVLSVVIILYFAWFHRGRGQTPGKRSARTKVVMLDGSPISGGVSFMRAVYYYFPSLVASALGLVLMLYVSSRREAGLFETSDESGVNSILVALVVVAVISWIYAFADAFFALIDRSRQRSIHDRLAGTRVVRTS